MPFASLASISPCWQEHLYSKGFSAGNQVSFAFAGVTMPESQTRPDSLAQKRVEMIF